VVGARAGGAPPAASPLHPLTSAPPASPRSARPTACMSARGGGRAAVGGRRSASASARRAPAPALATRGPRSVGGVAGGDGGGGGGCGDSIMRRASAVRGVSERARWGGGRSPRGGDRCPTARPPPPPSDNCLRRGSSVTSAALLSTPPPRSLSPSASFASVRLARPRQFRQQHGLLRALHRFQRSALGRGRGGRHRVGRRAQRRAAGGAARDGGFRGQGGQF